MCVSVCVCAHAHGFVCVRAYVFLGFHAYSITSSTNNASFISSFPVCMLSFLFVVVMPRTQYNSEVIRITLYLVPNTGRKVCSHHPYVRR